MEVVAANGMAQRALHSRPIGGRAVAWTSPAMRNSLSVLLFFYGSAPRGAHGPLRPSVTPPAAMRLSCTAPRERSNWTTRRFPTGGRPPQLKVVVGDVAPTRAGWRMGINILTHMAIKARTK